jgi:PAS domain S-box-containing protein
MSKPTTERAERNPPAPSEHRSLRSYLFFLALAPLALLVLVTGAFIWTEYEQQRQTVMDGLRETAHAFALAVERELAIDRTVLETLATSELIDAADWRAFHAYCVKLIEQRQDGAIIVMDSSGQMLLNTGVPFGTPLPRLSPEVALQTVEWEGRELPVSNSPMLFESLASGRAQYGDLYYGRVGKRPAVAISVPVIRDGKAIYAIAISSTTRAFSTLLEQEPNSPDLDMLIIDRAGRIISRDTEPEKFIGRLAPEPLHNQPAGAQDHVGETVVFNHQPFLYASSRSPLSGWNIVVATPRDRVITSIRKSFAPWLAVVVVLIATGIFFAQRLWRRVAIPLNLLTDGAEAIQRGEQCDIPASGIREVDTLSQMLRHASAAEHAKREEIIRRQLAEEREKITVESAEELRRSEQRYRSLFDNNLDAIFSLNSNGYFVSGNAAAGRLGGYKLQKLKDVHFLQLCVPELRDQTARAFYDILGSQSRDLETAILRNNGTRIELFVTGAPVIVDDEVVGVSCIGRDITERKRLTAELQQRVQELKHADQRKDEFLAMLAHELRNPLAPIRNAVEYLRIKGAQDPSLNWFREVIERQVAQMARLMDDLLDVSRITRNKLTLRKERVSLEKVLRDAIETSRPLFDGRIQLITNLPGDPLWLDADPTRLSQVFSNLLNNAAKYTRDGGQIRVNAAREASNAIVTVQDTGIGISNDLLPKMFDMFVQGDRAHLTQGGLGLGLTLARDIVQIHNGSIEAKSAGHNQGSEFVVRLPLGHGIPEEENNNAELESNILAATSRSKQILIVEDNNNQAESLARLLTLMGHTVRTADDGRSALEALAEFAPNVALIDIGLPDMSGYEVAQRIRARLEYRHTTLVAQTGWGREEDLQRAREAGFDHHLVKPIDHQLLGKILNDP